MGNAKHMVVGCALSLVGCVADVGSEADVALDSSVELAETDAALCSSTATIDARRSLAVTEERILERFSFERVMNRLVAQARIPGLTATQLFQQWWDTQNAGSSLYEGPHCDDVVDETLGSVINDFPYSCRNAPEEGAQASCDPFTDESCAYIPIGLFNRFDLAPADGATCGEYRVVFAKKSGQENARDRNLVIFEASLPNPEPWKGLNGCRPVVNFWAELSRIDSLDKRARMLEQFYFQGLSRSIPAVIDIRHYGDNAQGRGQVRTNQFVQDIETARAWSLREFKLDRSCERVGRRESCSLRFVPVTAKTNPYGALFAAEETHDKWAGFQSEFVGEVATLAAPDVLSISMNVSDTYNSAQSQTSGSQESDLMANFSEESALSAAIAKELVELDSNLTALNIVERTQTQTCAGCHRFSNGADLGDGLVWPASLGFTHVDERNPETVDGVTRFVISNALTDTFLPARKATMEQFLRGRRSYARGAQGTVGGGYTH
jgi:hypothetical protein